MIVSTNEIEPRLQDLISAIKTDCTSCALCQQDCGFLRKYGTPGEISDRFDLSDPKALTRSFECSLCGLCASVCPQGLEVHKLFLELRSEAVKRGLGLFTEHKVLSNYERLGTSRRFSWYGLPKDCTTVFFPGCGLSGTRPEAVKRLYSSLQLVDQAMGIVFDCCMKPSYSLGRKQHATAMFEEMEDWLVRHGVGEVLVACPNCHDTFTSLGQRVKTATVWEVLSRSDIRFEPISYQEPVAVHDPCAVRTAEPVHQAVRSLLMRQGLTIEEMPHFGKNTVCCGQGGAVKLLDPELATGWAKFRKKEAGDKRIVTYCAACVTSLQAHVPTSHLADILFDPQQTLAGRRKGAGAPFTYLNRIRLKRAFKGQDGYEITRERTFTPETEPKKNRWKPLVFLMLLIAAIAGAHLSGAGEYLQQDRLRGLISGYGALAPAIYILIYALAPVLFLPGLPITIAGGVLFGPFWGVVYTITGATIGASLAFLVARYVARDWVASKLTSPRWEKLDSEVARHGWKVVAFTRLIPAFPFNLLNYAFGLTKIPFVHYLIATFFCMLPACIAFIVFSSSLLNLIRGHVSPTALIGIALIILVSLLPVVYRRLKSRKSEDGVAGG